MSFVEQFRSEMHGNGLSWAGEIVADGKLHRFKTEGDHEANSWYVLHQPNPIAAGAYGCWKRNFQKNWSDRNGDRPSGKELAELQRQWRIADQQRAKEEESRQLRMAEKAKAFLTPLKPAAADHLYLQTKGVGVHGLLEYDGSLILPLQDAAGDVWSYQSIDALGDKLFMPGGKVEGCYFELAEGDGPLAVCEGYATGASIHEATGWPTICALNCGNLLSVCKSLRAREKERLIVICADDDRFTMVQGEPKNPGMEKAQAAAKEVKAIVCKPLFPKNSTGTDFNDLHQLSGLSQVATQLSSTVSAGLGERITIRRLLEFVPKEDPDCVLGERYLCRGDSCSIIGQTHVGKSSFCVQWAAMMALGGDFFGITSNPRRPLKSLIVQAENNIGDMAEMFQGVLLGSGLIREGSDDQNREIGRVLEQNLVLVRDQTHVGANFAAYAERLIEIHKPDFFWVDPMLSFYGADINDQESMSNFLRTGLNPISERTGVIWMMLHHTGKPSKDQKKQTKGWSNVDYAYMGIGSSEFSNWARATVTILKVGDDEFRVVLGKRGWRAGAEDEHKQRTTDLYLAHSSDLIYWKRIPRPDDQKTEGALVGFVKQIQTSMTSTEIIELASNHLERGKRTCWKLWEGGSGPLGSLFVREPDTGKWLPKHLPGYSPD